MNKITVLIVMLVFSPLSSFGEKNYPHILVNNDDKQVILKKIEEQKWAKTIFDDLLSTVNPYVERHQTDPDWILSRYLMNRAEGKRYTHAYDNGTGHYLVSYSGDAPVPTVRVSTHKRAPVTEKGGRYIVPSIEELIPNDTSSLMWIFNTETNQKDLIDPQSFINSINGEINDLALGAAVIYWLKGDERYARFSADILNQWARGAYYQEPIVGACRTGFLSIQTLGENSYQGLILAYDFVYPYMKQHGYNMSYYQNVFSKFASTLTYRGFWDNNWYAAVTATWIYAVLSLDDANERDYYLQFFLERDTINGSCGRLGLPSTIERHLSHDGFWKETGGYHNFAVSNLVRAAWAMEKNGYDIFQKFPELFKATHALLKYSFPNLRVSAFGDAGYASQDPQTLELGLTIAAKHSRPELSGMMSVMRTLLEGGIYSREQSGLYGLLSYLPELPEIESAPYQWPRGGGLDFARFYLQRNSMDPENGLMYGVQGATYNHNHNNGMAMELFGCGQVMGIDAGTGPNYDHPLHQNYFSQWAAHNTVVSGGSSSSVPPNGSAGEKNIGQVELVAMEPMPDKEAVSPFCSFTGTSYFDISTKTNQLRTMAIIRTSETSGYYVDIYRSDNKVANDYVYHNPGDKLSFMDGERQPLPTKTAEYPLIGEDYPGFRYFSEVEKLEGYSDNLIGLFPVNDGDGNYSFMQVLVPGGDDRVYYRAKSPAAKTAGRYYSGEPCPVFTIRTGKEVWSDPFIVVFEPYCSENSYSVKAVEKMTGLCNENNTVIRVIHVDGSEQIIFQGNDTKSEINNGKIGFSGHFGVASLNKKGKLVHLYMGEGRYISYGDISITAKVGQTSTELQISDDKSYNISSNDPVTLKVGKIRKKS